MRWPHHSWRLTFQSWMSSIQSKKIFSKRARHEARAALAHRRHGPLGHRLDVDEPLGLDARLDDVVAALAVADDHLVGLRLDEVAARLEVGQDARRAPRRGSGPA